MHFRQMLFCQTSIAKSQGPPRCSLLEKGKNLKLKEDKVVCNWFWVWFHRRQPSVTFTWGVIDGNLKALLSWESAQQTTNTIWRKVKFLTVFLLKPFSLKLAYSTLKQPCLVHCEVWMRSIDHYESKALKEIIDRLLCGHSYEIVHSFTPSLSVFLNFAQSEFYLTFMHDWRLSRNSWKWN